MMMRPVLVLLLMLLLQKVSAQTALVFKLSRQWVVSAGLFSVDNLGNVYVVSDGNQLKKLGTNGDSAVYNEVRRYGSISSVDVSNPLKLILFYRDYMTVVALDRFLNRLYTIDLRKAGILQAQAVTLAYDNNCWVFDEQNCRLKKVNDQGQVLFESNDLRQFFGEVIAPVEIMDQDGLVYLNDPKRGIYVFDYYGGFKSKYSLTGVSGVKVIGKTVMGFQQGALLVYKPITIQEEHLALPVEISNASQWQLLNRSVYALKPDGLFVYTF